jgi:hypothetical protein
MIRYQPGGQNGAADALSRKVELAPEDPEEEEPLVMISRDRFTEIATIVTELTKEEVQEVLLAATQVIVESDQGIQQQIRKSVADITLPQLVTIQDSLPLHEDRVYVLDLPGLRAQLLQLQ